MTRTIPLTRGYVALVDDEDYDHLNQWNWYAGVFRGVVYAMRVSQREAIMMHRVIMGLSLSDGRYVDHRNHEGTDNRRSNLRVCSQSMNLANQRSRTGSSRYKGVYWHKQKRKWAASIKVGGKTKHLGRFAREEDAARAYDARALEEWGEYALLNFPET